MADIRRGERFPGLRANPGVIIAGKLPPQGLMFEDFKARLKSDNTREVRRTATSALLALATPRLSSFMFTFFIGPYYERENRKDIATAVYEEALKWTADASDRRDLEEKLKSLK